MKIRQTYSAVTDRSNTIIMQNTTVCARVWECVCVFMHVVFIIGHLLADDLLTRRHKYAHRHCLYLALWIKAIVVIIIIILVVVVVVKTNVRVTWTRRVRAEELTRNPRRSSR